MGTTNALGLPALRRIRHTDGADTADWRELAEMTHHRHGII